MKRIVICLDGTGQKFQENKSNPLRLHYCLKNSDEQVSFYDPGVGTFDPDDPLGESGLFGGVVSAASEFVGGKMFGYGIEKNLADAYRYLMNVYEEGDAVFLFGFSRGAFAVHALAGFLGKCGLLGENNDNLIPYALDIYLSKDNEEIARDFKATMARDCPVKMIGAWDTVKSLGPKHRDDFFYDVPRKLCTHGRHFVASDERRKDFAPELWKEDGLGNHHEIWFPGVHGDVGGGNDENPLANASLKAMIGYAKDLGLVFHPDRIDEFDADITAEPHASYHGHWLARGAADRVMPEGALVHPRLDEHRTAHGLPSLPAHCVRADM